MKPYLIMAPNYRNSSAGVRALYELRQHLQDRGYDATICQGGMALPDSIVVYPETVPGNPLRGKTVVRLVLNFPGLLGGDKQYDPSELIFAYHQHYYPGAPVLTIPVIEDFFRDEKRERSGGCYWVGKGFGVRRIPETEDLTEITLEWPASREELARLFNKKEVFYTYDDNTAMITEARMCGCRVVVVTGEKQWGDYQEAVKDFDSQLEHFIKTTQEAIPENKHSIGFGVMINDMQRFDWVLKQSAIDSVEYVLNPERATIALNELMDRIQAKGFDVAALVHQDMYFRQGWIAKAQSELAKLPKSWTVAGIIGKDAEGRICGKLRDMRVPQYFNTCHIHSFPYPACCFDECVILVNLTSGFRFDESMDGFDLYGTLAVLQAWERGGSAWIIDAPAEHYCMRPFSYIPDERFKRNYEWLWDRFSKLFRVDSTAIGTAKGGDARDLSPRAFMTSAS